MCTLLGCVCVGAVNSHFGKNATAHTRPNRFDAAFAASDLCAAVAAVGFQVVEYFCVYFLLKNVVFKYCDEGCRRQRHALLLLMVACVECCLHAAVAVTGGTTAILGHTIPLWLSLTGQNCFDSKYHFAIKKLVSSLVSIKMTINNIDIKTASPNG